MYKSGGHVIFMEPTKDTMDVGVFTDMFPLCIPSLSGKWTFLLNLLSSRGCGHRGTAWLDLTPQATTLGKNAWIPCMGGF